MGWKARLRKSLEGNRSCEVAKGLPHEPIISREEVMEQPDLTTVARISMARSVVLPDVKTRSGNLLKLFIKRTI